MTRRFDPVRAPDWQKVERLFARAVELSGPDRAAWLERECAGDAGLRERLRTLLAAHDALEASGGREIGFLETLDVPRAEALLDRAVPEPGKAERIGRYRVVRRLGEGGMGLVYLAHDPALERHVALKLLPRAVSADPVACRRFVEEARAASALEHPHIATVYEIGETDDGRPFIAMACYEGGTLRQRMGSQPLGVDEAAGIGAQVADGLAAAHASGIVHRDVKPENLVFDGRGAVRIVDFGIAKVAAASLTRTGTTLGTAAYMSPEQTRGAAVDHRADLWSLGVVLYEMLAGRRPFGGDSPDAVIYGIRNDPPEPLRSLRPEVPPALAELVERCLEKDPARRPTSAADLREALLDAAASEAPAERAAARGAAEPREETPGAFAGRWRWAAVYLACSALVMLLAGQAASRFLLPAWVQTAAAALLVLGIPVLLATERARRPEAHAGPRQGRQVLGLLTWPRAFAGAAMAFAALVAAIGFVVVGGAPRVTGAQGHAGAAFPERGWVLVADFEAAPDAPGAAGVALAAREALGVDLQQSGFVNVIGRAQAAGVLRRMGLPDTTVLAGAVALEVAERAGAGAVLSVTVSRLGPQYVLSGRALRPGTGEELFAVRTAAGERRLLGGVERLSREMRRRLGEERNAVRRSRPLPDVATPSLDALRLYAEAERLLPSDPEAAARLAAEAIRADSSFAMAHRMAAVIAGNQLRFGDARHHLDRAFAHRERLPERERWHLEGVYLANVAMQPQRAAEVYSLLLRRFPDDARATHNLAVVYQSWMDDPVAAYPLFLRAGEQQPLTPLALVNAGHAAFQMGEVAVADSLAELAEGSGFVGYGIRWRMARAFALGEHRRVVAVCDTLLAAPARTGVTGEDREFCGSADVAAGRLRRGSAQLATLEGEYLRARRYRHVAHVAQTLAVAEWLRGDTAAAAAHLERVLEAVPAEAVPEPDRFLSRINLQVQAALLGRPALVERIGAAYPAHDDPTHWISRKGEALVAAALLVAAGDGERALRRLDSGVPTDLKASGWRIWVELLRGTAHDLAGRPGRAAFHLERAADPRYHTLAKLTKDRIHLPIALRRLAAAEEARGDTAAATRAFQRLAELWEDADPELRGEVASLHAALARLGAGR